MVGLNLNGVEMQKQLEAIQAENKITLEANTKDGVSVEAGRTWSNGFGLAGFFRAKSKKDLSAGVKGEFKF